MRRGLPYLGSKSVIADSLLHIFPPAETFVDLFCGGCSVTHAALRSGMFRRIVTNDLDGRMPLLFLSALRGELFGREKEWVSRSAFFARKTDDAFLSTVWSFGSNGETYIYAAEREAQKEALHFAIFFSSLDRLRALYGEAAAEKAEEAFRRLKSPRERRIWLTQALPNVFCWDNNLDSARRAERILSLAEEGSALRRVRLEASARDYREVPIPAGAVVYADPPYKGAACYAANESSPFDREAFLNWLRAAPFPVYVSEYQMPEDFVVLWECRKRVTYAPTNNSKVSTERLYVYEKWAKSIYSPFLFPLSEWERLAPAAS